MRIENNSSISDDRSSRRSDKIPIRLQGTIAPPERRSSARSRRVHVTHRIDGIGPTPTDEGAPSTRTPAATDRLLNVGSLDVWWAEIDTLRSQVRTSGTHRDKSIAEGNKDKCGNGSRSCLNSRTSRASGTLLLGQCFTSVIRSQKRSPSLFLRNSWSSPEPS